MRGQLSEVLHIYCALPGSLPYRQGMSHLAAVLLLHLQEPALTCASLSSLLGGYPILRACASLHLRPAVEFFDATLARLLPALAARLSRLEISSHLYLMPWILTLFSRSLPLSTACRIWDRVLADGEAELFRAALAILQLLQPVLLLAGFEEAVQLLTNLPMLPADETDALETAPMGGASDTSAPSRALVSLDEGVVAAAAATITTMATGGAARHDQMVEAELLATMTRVQLPQAEFEKLLVRCIVHGGRSEEL